MTADQVRNVNALLQELAKIPERKRDECIKAARMIVFGVQIAEDVQDSA